MIVGGIALTLLLQSAPPGSIRHLVELYLAGARAEAVDGLVLGQAGAPPP